MRYHSENLCMQPVLSHKSLGWEVHSLIPTLFTIWLSSFVQLVVLCQSVLDFTSFGFQCLSLLHDSVFPLSSFFILISFFFLNAPLISPYAFICFLCVHHAVFVHFSKLSLHNFFSVFRGTHYNFFLLYFSAIPHWNCWSISVV